MCMVIVKLKNPPDKSVYTFQINSLGLKKN